MTAEQRQETVHLLEQGKIHVTPRAKNIRDQRLTAGIPFFKPWRGFNNKKPACRDARTRTQRGRANCLMVEHAWDDMAVFQGQNDSLSKGIQEMEKSYASR